MLLRAQKMRPEDMLVLFSDMEVHFLPTFNTYSRPFDKEGGKGSGRSAWK